MTAVLQSTTVKCMGRVNVDGVAGVEADFSSITYKTFLHDGSATADTETDTGTLTVADVIHDVLKTDLDWTEDSTGYNFSFAAPAAGFASEGLHEVVVTFNETGGATGKHQWLVRVVHSPE